MMRTIKMLWANYKHRTLDLQHYEGFNWAAGELLRGRPVEELKAQSLGTFNRTAMDHEFDRGVHNAIRAFDLLKS